ncbi:MAG: hemerythrin domain-containing protein [Candidatus Dadabacteria bacterium]
MNGGHQPIKRIKELAPLSVEHHDGLMLVWKIRQGLRNGTPIHTIADYIQWFWTNHLEQHFHDEKVVLAPYLPKGDEMIEKMLEDHEELESMVRINEAIPDKEMMIRFADALHEHIRFEERKLFPYAEQVLSREDLEGIYNKLHKETKESSSWSNEFWIRR